MDNNKEIMAGATAAQAEKKSKILVIDDEEDICEILQYNLERAGYDVKTAISSEEALYMIPKENFDLLILDIMLGGISGLKLAQLLREDYKNNIPIIFVTALDTEPDILQGFKTGGDDYIPKPFSVKEVVARVGAVLNRYKRLQKKDNQGAPLAGWQNSSNQKPEVEKSEYDFGILKINNDDKKVLANGNEVFLTKKEMEILLLLAKYPGKIFSRDDILKLVWKDESYVLERTVDVHIARLRKKLGKAGDLIMNRSGYGYSLQADEKDSN
ncbi:MAG TPA: response regulator transcription factor [Candidatus Egerieousia sp.]|nr:response regulator transcription factor [Candidatus Egerieousia sp.]